MKYNFTKYKNYAKKNFDKYNRIVNIISNIRLITFILMIIFFIMGYYNNYYFYYLSILMLVLFIILIFFHNNYYIKEKYFESYLKIIDTYIDRLSNKWKDFKDKGEDFLNDDNVYLKDLDVLGDNSLFQFLNISKTKGGRRRLYNRFITVNKDYDSILELTNNIDFCIDYQINLLKYEDKSVDLEDNYKYFKTSGKIVTVDLIIGIILSLGVIITLLLGLFKIISIRYFYGAFIFNFLAGFLYKVIFNQEFDNVVKCISNYEELESVFKCVINTKFTSKKLNDLQDNINNSMEWMKKLERIEILNNISNNLIASIIFNGLFSINILTLYYYSNIKLDNKFKKGVEAVLELESMISLSVIGAVKKHTTIPKISSSLCLEFTNLYHPLIKEENFTCNTFSCRNGVNIITGSNMGGKSTFLRTIGINLIISNAGGMANADKFVCCNFKIFTSMRVSDDVLRGISTFYAELLRIKKAIDYSKTNKPLIVLVDEIFKGTNYNDRIYGACEVIKKLNKDNVILFITTHDFELCDIDNVSNYHFKEYYENDYIKFDYLIKNGKCNSTNARYLMKHIGIIE